MNGPLVQPLRKHHNSCNQCLVSIFIPKDDNRQVGRMSRPSNTERGSAKLRPLALLLASRVYMLPAGSLMSVAPLEGMGLVGTPGSLQPHFPLSTALAEAVFTVPIPEIDHLGLKVVMYFEISVAVFASVAVFVSVQMAAL